MTDPATRPPQWRQDFPIRWEEDHYVTRRELAKFLGLGSGLLVAANTALALIGRAAARVRRSGTAKRVGLASSVPKAGSFLFRYPTDDDPCIGLRTPDGRVVAYSQVCTHLSCAVVHRPESNMLYCPCHAGCFATEDGRPTAGPPERRLARIRIEQRGDEIWAVGKEA